MKFTLTIRIPDLLGLEDELENLLTGDGLFGEFAAAVTIAAEKEVCAILDYRVDRGDVEAVLEQ